MINREDIAKRDNYTCQKCDKYLGSNGCIAHRIAQSKANYKKYGSKIIDHEFNKVYSCITNNCNDSFNIGNKPLICEKLVKLIREDGKLSTKNITVYLKGE